MLPVGRHLLGGRKGNDTITLSGSSGTPNTAYDTGATAICGWEFRTDGTVYKLQNIVGDAQFSAGTEWNGAQPTVGRDYYIRFTEQSFTGDGTRFSNPGSSWLQLSGSGGATRRFEVDDPVGTGVTTWVMKVEIARDALGSNILATGYYQAQAESV